MERTCFMMFLLALRIIGILSGGVVTAMFAVLFIRLLGRIGDDGFEQLYPLFALCGYGAVLGAISTVTELRFGILFKHFPSLLDWIVRGFYFVFVGVLCVSVAQGSLNVGDIDKDTIDDITDYACYAHMICGLIYIVMGALCLKGKAQSEAKANKGPDIV